jgi:hypothetical protein
MRADTPICWRILARALSFMSGRALVHVFPANLVFLQAAREALDLAGEFLRRKRSLAE